MTAPPLSVVLEIPPGDVPRLKDHPLIRGPASGRAVTRRTRTVYYDTADLALRRRRLSVHVNQAASAPGAVPAGPAGDADILDVNQVTDPAVREAIAETASDQPLQAVFDSTIERTTRLLRPSQGSRIRVELEVGTLRGGAGEMPIARVDLGLEAGPPRTLFDLVRELQRSLPLRLSTQPDAERGYALVAGAAPRAQKATPVEIDAAMTVDAVLQRVVRACLDQLIANEPAVREAQLAEGVHQMRVAIRRLRSALSLFRKLLPPAQDLWLRGETKWLAGVLGAARDWDVFLAETVAPAAASFPGEVGFERLRARAEAERAACHARVRAALDSERYTGLLLELRAWLEASGWREQPVSADSAMLFFPIDQLAGRLIETRRRKALKRGDDLRTLDPGERHEARKDVKKLRYAFEFFHALYVGRKAKRFARDLAKLQEGLGRLNDGETARRLLGRLDDGAGSVAEGRDPAVVHAAGLIAGWHAGLAEKGIRKLDKPWARLHAQKPFWD
jgi:inorganic triphosphatase YgiF